MKKTKLLTLILFIFCLTTILAGCSDNRPIEEKITDDLIVVGNIGAKFDLVRDTNTGCVYIYFSEGYETNLTPYYGEDGEIQGCGEKNLDKSKYN